MFARSIRRMGEVHQLLLRHGLEHARTFAATKMERNAIDAAAAIMADEEGRLGITHAGFAMTSLPHKKIEEGLWRREGHRTTLLVESGRSRSGNWVGVPYGSIARLILLYLQTEAVRTNSPEVELGRSMKSSGFRLIRQIKPTFTEALNLALAVYPEACIDLNKQGLVLHPSPPAVPKAEAKRLGIA
jgi:Plasmid encoded RepA protein